MNPLKQEDVYRFFPASWTAKSQCFTWQRRGSVWQAWRRGAASTDRVPHVRGLARSTSDTLQLQQLQMMNCGKVQRLGLGALCARRNVT